MTREVQFKYLPSEQSVADISTKYFLEIVSREWLSN